MSKVSLIPYLDPGDGKFYLEIFSPEPTNDGDTYFPYPFQLLSDAEPYSRLYKAQLVSRSGQPVSPLFLLVQRDSYRYKPDEIWPLGNPDLENYWQETYSYVSTKDNIQNHFFPLEDTTSPEGKLVPFHSLFFCKFKKRFFHPPCPVCGEHLELCKDDQLLSSIGLMPYSTTLKRYLFCPSCPQDNTDVYVYTREDTDPLLVKDLRDMVRSWRNIAAGRIESGFFPCADCSEQIVCFGETDLSITRIIPFNFYPSFILSFKASSMSAIDFLPLISGAAVDELIQLLKGNRQLARLNCLMEWQQLHGSSDLFLHSGKAQQFLEILYLKLSFLGDVARILLTSGAAPIPADISAAIDCIWINLPTHNSLLPSYWNFDINLFTFGSCGKYTDNLPISHPSQACYCLGIIWFFALLRNRKQSIHTVKEALKQILNRPAETFLENEFPVFAPENIFWNPDAHQPTDILNEWRVIWAHSLTLGKRLLQGNCSEKIDAGAENVFTDLEKIRQNIKQYLFYGEMATGTALPKQTADAEIHRILSGMLEKWKVNIPTPPPPQHSREETLTETVILSKNAGAGFSKNVGAAAKKTYPSGRTEEVLQETVILKTKTTPSITSKNTQKPHTPMGESAADEKNDMPETLILKPSYNKTDNKKNE